ncbi:hypothetical protein Tco_1368815 [Tanacetum coccineum]
MRLLNSEEFELFENNSLDFVKLVEAACDDKLDKVIVGGYGTHLGAIGGVEEFIKNSVKKNGSEVLEMECSVVDESEVKNSVKNGKEVLEMECSVVDVKKEEGFEEVRKDKWADWKELVFKGSGNGYGTYSYKSAAPLVVGKRREGVRLDICKWPKRKKACGIYCQVKNSEWKFDIWRWPKRKKKYVLNDIWGVWKYVARYSLEWLRE